MTPEERGTAWTDAFTEHMELRYAERFAVDRDGEGRALVTIAGTERFLLLPEGTDPPDFGAEGTVPENRTAAENGINAGDGTAGGGGITVLRLPLRGLYVAASSSMDFFNRLDALDAVRFTSTSRANWTLDPVREAMDRGELLYAGKYSTPDMERLLAEGCPLAVESTMIFHTPDIREQLEALGIPVLVERSSYEPHPLGRMEWLKLYGLLTGREEAAAAFFTQQAARVERIQAEIQAQTQPEAAQAQSSAEAGKTVAFFSVSTQGAVTVRKPGDYVSKMIEMAGGRYVFSDLLPEGDNALSTMNLQMEAFYAGAVDADILIYNGTIDGGMETVEQLLGKSELFADFRAVQTGEVWCTERNLFQEPTAAGEMIADFHAVFSGTAENRLPSLHRLIQRHR